MGACGCTSGNKCFRLRAPDGWYVIEFMPGCDYCLVGPGVQIHHPEAAKYFDDEIKHMEDLPVLGDGEMCVTMIKCGLDPGEAEIAAVKCFVGAETEDNRIDKVLAEILGEDFWKDALRKSPSVICPMPKS